MIPRPPPQDSSHLFRTPVVYQPGARSQLTWVDGVWCRVTDVPVADAELESCLHQAARAYYSSDYAGALALIEAGLEREDLSLGSHVALVYARVETLLVMGRLSDGYAVLAKRLERPRGPADYIRRCWLWAAQRELGLDDAAREELAWLDSDAHAATRNDALCIFLGASFFAVFGELDIAERMLVRMLRARTMADYCTPDVIEGNTRLGWLASRGVAGDAGAAWGEGLLDRVRAEAARLGPL